MAQRRMFSKSITNSSQFLMMPSSSQNLYFHLGMNADDDGFCEHFALMRMTDSKPDDLRILQAKGFVNVFDDKVLIITDWKENNYLRSDRYSASKYLDVYKKELKLLAKNMIPLATTGIPNGDTGKDRIGKDRIGKDRIGKDTTEQSSGDINLLIKTFEEINPACKSYYARPPQRKACSDLIFVYGFDRVKTVIEKTLPKTNTMQFFPKIITPLQLWEKWSMLENAVKGYKSEKQIKNNVAF